MTEQLNRDSFWEPGCREEKRIGFHLHHKFQHAMLDPVYKLLRDDFPSIITEDVATIIKFKPKILILADAHYYCFRAQLPETMIIWIRHGFSSKNFLKRSIIGCDFACVSSEWVRDEYLRRGWRPRLGYWVTGFVPMDKVFARIKSNDKKELPVGLSPDQKTLLYAPTWNKYLGSADVLGDRWIDIIKREFPEINLIIKPHPHIPKLFPKWMKRWRESANRHERTVLIENCSSSIYEFLHSTDVLLSDSSSVIFYFLALNRPIILVKNPKRYRDMEFYDPEGPEWSWRDFGCQIEDVEELPTALRKALEDPEEFQEARAVYCNRIFGDTFDGLASQRIREKVRSLLQPNSEEKEWTSVIWEKLKTYSDVYRKKSLMYRIQAKLNPLGSSLNRYPRIKYIIKKFFPA